MLIKLHRWIGLVLSLAILTISLTGTLLLWKTEYLWLDIAQARQELHTDKPALALSIERIEHSYAANEVRSIQLHANDLALHKVFLTERRYAWHDQHGIQIEQWQGNERLEDFLLDLHHRFLLGNTIGLNIAGFSGLLVVPLGLAGLFIWWPRRRTFQHGLLPGKWRRAPVLRSHGNLGIVSLAAIILTAITGVILVYPEEAREVLLEPFLQDSADQEIPEVVDDLQGQSNADWRAVLTRAHTLYPGARFRWVSPATESYPYRIVGVQQQQGWNSSGQTAVYVEASSGTMSNNTDALRQPAAQRLFNFSYPLHTGGLGLWYRILLSLFGVSIALLSFFGLASYLKR